MATTLNGEALIILRKNKRPMTAKEMYKEIEKRGNLKLITKTPVASLNSELYKDIKKNRDKSKFIMFNEISGIGKSQRYFKLNENQKV